MPHSPARLLQDTLDAGDAIGQFTRGHTLDDYEHDLVLRPAVERPFEIIGEALNRLYRLDPDTAARLGPYRQVIVFRNTIAPDGEASEQTDCRQVVVNWRRRDVLVFGPRCGKSEPPLVQASNEGLA